MYAQSIESQTDSPTHRLHILQMSLPKFKADLEAIRVRRGLIIEKIAKVKANSKIERQATVNKQLQRFFTKTTKDLEKLNKTIAAIEDNMNKMRALILELSDGELMLPKTEIPNGDA